MKWFFLALVLILHIDGFSQIDLKSINQTKELIKGKWDIFEYCVYEANFCKKDTSSSIIFQVITGENKIHFTLLEKGIKKKEGIVGLYDFIKVRTTDKYTLDNFLFSPDYALIVSFLDSNKLCLLQNSYQGFAKHYKRDITYKAQPILLLNSEK